MPDYSRPYFSASPPTAPADVLGSSAAPVTLGATIVPANISTAVDVDGHKYVVFFVHLLALGGATKVMANVFFSPTGGAAPTEWSSVKTEDVTTGVAVQSVYEIEQAVSAPGLVIVAPIPTRGVQYYSIGLRSDGTPDVYVQYRGSGGPI